MHDGSNVRLTMVQLPALNTPQFTWSRAKMPRQPQPVPPIFQPEVAAEAIVCAADHPRRELMVGWPTVKAIVGNAVAPGLADRYLADTGYDAQQTDEPLDAEPARQPLRAGRRRPGRARPVRRPREAHARVQLWATKHRSPLGVAAGAAAWPPQRSPQP